MHQEHKDISTQRVETQKLLRYYPKKKKEIIEEIKIRKACLKHLINLIIEKERSLYFWWFGCPDTSSVLWLKTTTTVWIK